MNEFSRSPRVSTGGSPRWLLPLICVGIFAGVALRFLAPDILTQTAIIGQIFGGILLIVSVPLVTSQLALALNNPRDRVRRGVSHSKILVQVVIATVAMLVITAVLTAFFTIQDSRGLAAVLLQNFNPVELVNFSSTGGGYVFIGLALVVAAVLGVMGDKAQEMVTVCGRISRASIRTFRLAMWLAPIGLLSMVGTLGTSSPLSSSSSTMTALALVLTATTGLLLYSSIVLGIDWIVGQLRPARKDGRRFERTSRTGQRPTTGRAPMTSRPGSTATRPVSRPSADTRRDRDRERSPFEMGVSSTPVLDITSPTAGSTPPSSASPDTSRRNDFRSRPNKDSQTERPRSSDRGVERESSTDSPRPGYRDRGPHPERREGGRDNFRERGPRGPRPDRPNRDRGPRPDRFDRTNTARPAEQANEPETSAPVNRAIDPASAAADLARIREQLNQTPPRESQTAEKTNTPEYNRPERVTPVAPPPERLERPVVSQEQPAAIEPVSAEMHYGRSRHRKHEKPETESRPGVEPPPMPEMVDHYSTDDMAFGRGKRKKTVK